MVGMWCTWCMPLNTLWNSSWVHGYQHQVHHIPTIFTSEQKCLSVYTHWGILYTRLQLPRLHVEYLKIEILVWCTFWQEMLSVSPIAPQDFVCLPSDFHQSYRYVISIYLQLCKRFWHHSELQDKFEGRFLARSHACGGGQVRVIKVKQFHNIFKSCPFHAYRHLSESYSQGL